MESIEAQKQSSRFQQLEQWIAQDCGLKASSIQALAGDASFRRYYRIKAAAESVIAMDAPHKEDNCESFVSIAKALRQMGLHTPEILAADLSKGFLLLSDFGDTTYLKKLNLENADNLYGNAIDALAILRTCQIADRNIPFFKEDWMWREWNWHKEWFLTKLLGLQISDNEKKLDECFAHIVKSAISQPQVFMHRDYHSANLMVLNDNQVGILDFQDAFIGPITYDLVSLLRDCYIDWPEERITQWVKNYWQASSDISSQITLNAFMRLFDLMGIERHLKALFTFARKQVRDQQAQYLKHIPRTFNYVVQVSERYPELQTLHHYFDTIVREKIICVA